MPTPPFSFRRVGPGVFVCLLLEACRPVRLDDEVRMLPEAILVELPSPATLPTLGAPPLWLLEEGLAPPNPATLLTWPPWAPRDGEPA